MAAALGTDAAPIQTLMEQVGRKWLPRQRQWRFLRHFPLFGLRLPREFLPDGISGREQKQQQLSHPTPPPATHNNEMNEFKSDQSISVRILYDLP